MAHPVANHRVYDLLDALEQKAVLRLMHDLGCDEAAVRVHICSTEGVSDSWLYQCERQVQSILATNTKGLTPQDLGR